MDGGGIENFEAVPCHFLEITNYKIQTKRLQEQVGAANF